MLNQIKGLLVIATALAALQLSCKKTDGYNAIASTDNTKPGPVTGIKVVNFNGGAYITYTLPDSKNILYVQAQYNINDKVSRQTKSSYYSDSITVSGFAQSQDYKVVLNVVSRANIKSDSVVVTVHPDTPPYLLILPTVSMQKDFGGVNISAKNKVGVPVGIITIAPDPVTNKYEIISQNYTSLDSISFSLRGFDTVSKKFGVYITDQWGNISDTVYSNITPIYEAQISKAGFKAYRLQSDVPDYGSGYVLENLWDGNTGDPTYNTQQPITSVGWPAWATFDMGQAAKLSRYTMWDRGLHGTDNFLWGAGAPKTWVIWGRADMPVDESMPDSANLPPLGQATPNGWINMGEFNTPPKPSGLPNPQYTSDDLVYWNGGFDFDFSLILPKVRYIRFECISNMGETNNFFDINEMSFFGDPR